MSLSGVLSFGVYHVRLFGAAFRIERILQLFVPCADSIIRLLTGVAKFNSMAVSLAVSLSVALHSGEFPI